MSDRAPGSRIEPFSVEHRANGSARAAMTAANKDRVDHPATSDTPYTDGESEFIKAVADFKSRTGRKFPTYSEQYKILLELGYSKPEA